MCGDVAAGAGGSLARAGGCGAGGNERRGLYPLVGGGVALGCSFPFCVCFEVGRKWFAEGVGAAEAASDEWAEYLFVNHVGQRVEH